MLKVIATGNLGRDPEVRYSKGGDPIANFSVAAKEYKDTEWLNAVAFKKTAELVGQYCRKGSKVLIEGTLKTSSWEKDGEKKYKTEVIVNKVEFLESRQDGGQQRQQAAQQQPQQAAISDDFDDDIPF